jgi:hypothetical protein
VCFHSKTFLQLKDVFDTRYRLFREVYRHRVVVGLDALMGDLLRELEPLLRVWLQRGIRPTDSLLALLPQLLDGLPASTGMDETRKVRALALWKRLRTRDLSRIEMAPSAAEANVHVRIGLSALPSHDPLDRLWFWDHRGTVQRISLSALSQVLSPAPRIASETLAFKLSRN